MARRTLRREPIVPTASCPPGWSWLFAGIFIGIFVSFLFYLREIAPNIPVVANEPAPAKVAETPAKKVTLDLAPTEVASPEPAEPQPEPERPPFEFYDTLVNAKATLPLTQPTPASLVEEETFPEETTSSEPVPVEVPGTYTLQVGSFRDMNTAEGLKAHLALLGISSYVQHVTLNGSDSWHRVRVGPITDLNLLNRIRTQLTANSLASNVVKWNEETN